MKRCFFFIITLVGFSSLFANLPEKIETLTSKVILQNTEGYFVLSDGSCWKVIGFSKRTRTLSEWWNNVLLAPESYNCVPGDWSLGAQIEVYSKYDNNPIAESNAANEEALKQCSHMFSNTRTRQVLFAIALEPEDCIIRLFNDAHSEGYALGYSQGKLEAAQNYQNGYYDGYSNGYNVGYKEGFESSSPIVIPQNQ